MVKVLVTGGAGFIGSHLVARLLARADIERVTVLDALTYAGNRANLGAALGEDRLELVVGTILNSPLVDELVAAHQVVVHLAAESHVDRSFFEAGNFVSTNVLGTQVLLEAAAHHKVEKFVHVSTDEVYGPILVGAARENAVLDPTVPYAASKAASDLVAMSYFRTYGVPVCITRSSNNYGPAQHPEKIIPAFITRLLKDEAVTLHGDGGHVRNWLHVSDNCQGIELVMAAGTPGEIYNIGGGTDLTNRELTGFLLAELGQDWDRVITVEDRRCNDRRYAMTWDKIADLGYRPKQQITDGLPETVAWYRDNPQRWAPLVRDPAAPLAAIQIAGPAGE